MSQATQLSFGRAGDGTLRVELAGSWTLHDELPHAEQVEREVESSGARRVAFESERITDWDSGLLTFLVKVVDRCTARQLEADRSGLPEGVRRLLDLAYAVPERADARRSAGRRTFYERLGEATVELWTSSVEMVRFLGEVAITFGRFATGRARFRRVDLWLTIQECGANALPIVSLISVLVGLILAFVGAVQLAQFGATIFVADLVGIGMAREMGALMAAVVMAGRTGAAFAAQLGTMTVNEEIDALRTMGISPIEFLVLPRMLALILMMPLLCLYANLLGIVGGFIVSVGMLDIEPAQYWQQMIYRVGVNDFVAGLIKSAVFGALVAVAGCLRGMQCGRSASAVGLAATSAVVTSLVFIVVSDSLLTVIYDVIDF